MSGYLGNPKFVMMTQDAIPIANFEYPVDPVVTVNPIRVPVSWLNTVTGKIWICTDNTTDANVWVAQGGGTVVYTASMSGSSVAIPNGWNKHSLETVDHEDITGIGDTTYGVLVVPAGVNRATASCYIQVGNYTTYINIKIAKLESGEITWADIDDGVDVICEGSRASGTYPVVSVAGGPVAVTPGQWLTVFTYCTSVTATFSKFSASFWLAPE